MENTIAVELKGIKKHFGPVKANDGVDLVIRRGEVLAVLGENGSGKSTLMNILSGLYTPDAGQIIMDGKEIRFSSPQKAIEKGIGMVHQHVKLVKALTAWENICIGSEPKTHPFLHKKKAIAKINALCQRYGLTLDPNKIVKDMAIGERQTVEIVKAMYRGADILILDEPTAVLTGKEKLVLFDMVETLRKGGCGIVLITHKLHEVTDYCNRVTVLRKGVSVASFETKDTTPLELANLMVGRSIDTSVPYLPADLKDQRDVLTINSLFYRDKKGKRKLDIHDLHIRAGEILGISGAADSGQKYLCEAITGLHKAEGSVLLNGQEILGLSPVAMKEKGIKIAYIPEDRLGMGLAPGMTVSDNAAIRNYGDTSGLFLNRKRSEAYARKLVGEYDVSTPSIHAPIRNLSGGNIQKVLLGRELDRDADLIVAAYPVRGLDIGASDYIYNKLNEQKAKGRAVLFVGEDVDVLMDICDRVAVIYSGRIKGILNRDNMDKDVLMLMLMGQTEEEARMNVAH